MTMLSLSRRLGITPRSDHEYDPAAAGWLDSARPEGAHAGAARPALVPQQWAGTSGVRDRAQAHYPADDQAGQVATARGPHPLGGEPEAALPRSADSGFEPGPSQPEPDGQQQSALPDGPWPEICDQFGSHLLVLAEQLRAAINALEAGEEDPDRLKRLYQVDHAVTRMRMASRQLRTLAGRDEERLPGFTTSLLDVIRMAASAIEWYPQVAIGPVAELAVPGYAADDVATLMSALLDNATRYSPGMVTVSCHLLEGGGVMFRVEDTGTGIGRDQSTRLNFALAGPVPAVDESAGRHMGFPIVHRIARKHSISVRFASRPRPDSGTIAMVTLPPPMVCAIPVQGAPRRAAPSEPARPEANLPEVVLPEPVQPEVIEPPVVLPEFVLPEAVAGRIAQSKPMEASHDEPSAPVELPRRDPGALLVREPSPADAAAPSPSAQLAPLPQRQQAAARFAFADDLSAFSEGIREALAARGITGGLVSAMFDGPTNKEGVQA